MIELIITIIGAIAFLVYAIATTNNIIKLEERVSDLENPLSRRIK